jgi:cytochrome c-type biogenesis protein CcmH/NrfG
MEMGRHQSAVKAFRDAIRVKPKSTDAWDGLRRACGALGDSEGLAEAQRMLSKLG